MKIVFCLKKFPTVSETFIYNQIETLMDSGHEIFILASAKGDFSPPSRLKQLEIDKRILFLDSPKNKFLSLLHAVSLLRRNYSIYGIKLLKLFFQSLLKNSLKRFCLGLKSACIKNPDAFMCHFGTTSKLFLDVKHFHPKTPLCVFFHGYDMSSAIKKHGKNTYNELFSIADALLPVSHRWKDLLITLGAPKEKICVLHMGIDLDKYMFQSKISTHKTSIHIVTVGRLVNKKGYDDSLKAIARLNANQKLHYTIIGSGPNQEKIESMIKKLSLEKTVCLLGSIPHEETKKYLESADIFLLPSKADPKTNDEEGIPVALMEAMACGVPVISTVHSGIPELIDDGETGWLVPEGDSNALYKALRLIIENPIESERRAMNARKKVLNDFDIKKIIKQLSELIISIKNIDRIPNNE